MSTINISEQYPDHLASAEASHGFIKSALRKLKIKSDLLKYSTGLLLWLASVSLLLIGWFLVGGVFHLPAPLRVPLILIWAGCVIWAVYAFILKTLIRRASSIEQIAFRLEQRHPELQDRLISSLQLWPELQENKYGYATDFIVRLMDEARASLEGIDRSEVLAEDSKKFRRAGFALICSLAPLIIMIALFPATFGNSLHTFVHPFEGIQQASPVEIIRVVPGDHKVPHGSDVNISAEVTGSAPPEADLHYRIQTANGEWRSMPLNKVTGDQAFGKILSKKEDQAFGKILSKKEDQALEKVEQKTALFALKMQKVRESLQYYISVADVESPRYSITVIHRPVISSLQLELHYPKYTRLPPRSLDANVGNFAAPLGTKAVISAKTSKDIASAFIVFDDETETRLEEREQREVTGGFVIQRSGRYHISITDTDGQSNSDPIEYSINVLADQPPRVSIVEPGADITVGEEMSISLQIEAQDDYGVAEMDLYYQIEGQGEEQKIPLASYDDPRMSASLSHSWDLNPLELFPEDVVSYYVEAADADNISGPNIGRSAKFLFRFPSLYELYEEIESDQLAEQLEMEDIRSRQDDVKGMVDELIDELKREKELDWAGKKELERASELQKQIEEQTKELAQQVDETVKKMEENPLVGLEAVEKVQELRDLMNELATDEMKQIMRKLSEALEKMDPSQQKRDLMAASFKQEEFIEKLDRMIELFKNMKIKQKMEAALKQAEELIRQQTEILEQSEQLAEKGTDDKEAQSKLETLADREERVKRQTEDLLGELDEIAEEMNENNPNIGEAMKQMAEQTKKEQIPDDLQCSISELENSKPANSLPCQRNALSKMSRLQDSLQTIMSAMEGQDMSEIMAGLQNAIRSSLYLSHRHEEVMRANSDFKGGPEQMLLKEKEIMDSLAADEIDLAEGARKVAAQLRELSHKTTSISPELVWKLGQAAGGMNRSAAAMEDKLPELVVPIQKNTLATLNSAIEDMLNSMDQMNAQSMPMMGMDDYMEQLRQLAEQQSQLNQSTQGADNIRRKQGMTPSLEEMLEKLAVEQSLVREATERLGSKLDQLAEVLGNLEQVARDMREVEDGLRQGYLGNDTVDKQRRILTRLLEYEKSLKREDFSRKREARSGRDFVVEEPPSVLPDDATKMRKQVDAMLSPSAEQEWPAQYRELIKMYYKALSNTVRK